MIDARSRIQHFSLSFDFSSTPYTMHLPDDIDGALKHGKSLLEDSLEHLQKELGKLRTGKASPDMVSDLLVSYYGAPTPLSQVSSVSTSDARTLIIQPWEKSLLPAIEKSIFEANMGLTPQNDGEIVRITIPPLTEERRKELVKKAKALGEEAKVSQRNIRRAIIDVIKKEVKNGYPEDAGKREEEKADKLAHQYHDRTDQLIHAKEKDIMTI